MQHGHFQRPLEIPAAHLEDLYIRRPKTLWVVVAACALSVMIRNTCHKAAQCLKERLLSNEHPTGAAVICERAGG